MTSEARLAWRPVVGLVFGLLVAGCGGPSTPAPLSDAELRRQGLAELGEAYTEMLAGRKHPAKEADLRVLAASHPNASRVLKSGECVFLYGTVDNNPATVIAHEKDVPTAGGLVLLKSGEVKSMTAAEFAAAPKAAGKK